MDWRFGDWYIKLNSLSYTLAGYGVSASNHMPHIVASQWRGNVQGSDPGWDGSQTGGEVSQVKITAHIGVWSRMRLRSYVSESRLVYTHYVP